MENSNSESVAIPARVVGSFDDYVEKRLNMEKYPEELMPKKQVVSPELAELLWKRFDEEHK